MTIIIIDNKDSFTHNIAQYITMVSGQEPHVFDNSIPWRELRKIQNTGFILSPGPGSPDTKKDVGVSTEVLAKSDVPILGICLGHQCLISASGGVIERAPEPFHGRTSVVWHSGDELFKGIPESFKVTRYHSLIAQDPLPSTLKKTCWTADGMIMGVAHKTKKMWGVQFHPESICSDFGTHLLSNFVQIANFYSEREQNKIHMRDVS